MTVIYSQLCEYLNTTELTTLWCVNYILTKLYFKKSNTPIPLGVQTFPFHLLIDSLPGNLHWWAAYSYPQRQLKETA